MSKDYQPSVGDYITIISVRTNPNVSPHRCTGDVMQVTKFLGVNPIASSPTQGYVMFYPEEYRKATDEEILLAKLTL